MSMIPKIKKLWVEALRSGEYEQGQGSMRKNGKFCCLGVLTDLYCKETGEKFRDQFNPACPAASAYEVFYIPTEVRRWSGLEQPEIMAELADRNDGADGSSSGYEGESQTFKQIATIVEVREDI